MKKLWESYEKAMKQKRRHLRNLAPGMAAGNQIGIQPNRWQAVRGLASGLAPKAGLPLNNDVA